MNDRTANEQLRDQYHDAARQGWKHSPEFGEKDEARHVAESLVTMKPWLQGETDVPPPEAARWAPILRETQHPGFRATRWPEPHNALRSWLATNGEPPAEREARLESEQLRLAEANARRQERERVETIQRQERLQAKADALAKLSSGNIMSLLAPSGEPEYEWLIEDLFERGDRVILTGDQGAGKSHLGLQCCYDIARGVHPLNGSPLDQPYKTMFIDMEIGKNAVGRILHMLVGDGEGADVAGVNMMHVDCAAGFEIMDDEDPMVEMIERRMDAFEPDFVWIGGLYKTTQANLGDSGEGAKACRAFQAWVDGWRMAREPEQRPVVCIEAHAGNKAKRPMGSSFWRNWPEFGLHLSKAGRLSPWRHQRDASRNMPSSLARADGRWNVKRSVFDDCFALIAAVGDLTYRELAERTGHDKSTISRVFTSEHKQQALDEFEDLSVDDD